MNGSAKPRLDTAQLAAAWDWVLRLQDDAVSQEDLAEWLRWYEADEQHKTAFDDMQSFWQQIDRVTEDPNPLAADLWLGGLAVSKSQASRLLAPESRPGMTQRLARIFGRIFQSERVPAWGAALVVLALGVSPVPRLPDIPPPPSAAQPAVVQETTLPDGSHVELAAKSSVALQFTKKQRLLDLQGGEAYFSVAHNRERPFIVQVGKLRVRAVGTAFNVRSAGDRVVVTVAEGTVDVYPASLRSVADSQSADGRTPGAVRVAAGSEVTWAASGPVIASVDPSHALAWRQGRLEYLNEPLASAVADINRYSARPIVIRDASVGQIIFSGTALTGATDSWIQALPSLFPVELQNDPNGNIVLVSRTPPAGSSSRSGPQ